MQAEKKNDLTKRSRYYQSLIDSSLLEPGSINFNLLNDTYIIMIMPFDLFGLNKYCYTFRAYCEEDKKLLLPDGTVRIFLNTKGTNDSEVSKELVAFLHYIEATTNALAEQSDSARIRTIHECVCKVKASEEMGVKYMQSWEEKIYEREKGRAEGITQGKADTLLSILSDLGIVENALQDFIMSQTDPELLDRWVKIAIKAESIAEFEHKIR